MTGEVKHARATPNLSARLVKGSQIVPELGGARIPARVATNERILVGGKAMSDAFRIGYGVVEVEASSGGVLYTNYQRIPL
jgi:hypothetical protein